MDRPDKPADDGGGDGTPRTKGPPRLALFLCPHAVMARLEIVQFFADGEIVG